MESPQASVNQKIATGEMRHVIYTRVAFADKDWVRFEGSQERIYFGDPHFLKEGDEVKITFEHVR